MSGPVPSPSMNGMTGASGTLSFPARISILSPAGGLSWEYVAMEKILIGWIFRVSQGNVHSMSGGARQEFAEKHCGITSCGGRETRRIWRVRGMRDPLAKLHASSRNLFVSV